MRTRVALVEQDLEGLFARNRSSSGASQVS